MGLRRKGIFRKLKNYFTKEPTVSIAYAFGSYAKGYETILSDFDIAVYFISGNNKIEIETEKEYPEEYRIWSDVEDIVGINCDFVVLNRAKVTLVDEILNTGIPIIIKDRSIYLDFLLNVTTQAEEFREFIKDFWEIRQRSASLSERDKVKLIERITFIENELSDIDEYKKMNLDDYQYDRLKRRSIERYVENIVNASIDITKIILASERKRIPPKYKDILLEIGQFENFNKDLASKLARYAELRNFLAHEYLDIRFTQIKEFVEHAEYVYKELINFVNNILKK